MLKVLIGDCGCCSFNAEVVVVENNSLVGKYIIYLCRVIFSQRKRNGIVILLAAICGWILKVVVHLYFSWLLDVGVWGCFFPKLAVLEAGQEFQLRGRNVPKGNLLNSGWQHNEKWSIVAQAAIRKERAISTSFFQNQTVNRKCWTVWSIVELSRHQIFTNIKANISHHSVPILLFTDYV